MGSLIKEITFPVPLEDIEDIYDDNVDVWVELHDGSSYTIVVATPKNLLTLMNRHETDFVEAGGPFVFVRKLTFDIIKRALDAHTEDNGYWLKLHHFSADIKSHMFKELQEDLDQFDIENDHE